MRVMGVDPGLTRCGLSVVENRGGRRIIALDVDVVRTPAYDALPRRLLTISEHVEHWLDTHHPDVIAIERVFANQNANTAIGTAQAGGVIALAPHEGHTAAMYLLGAEVVGALWYLLYLRRRIANRSAGVLRQEVVKLETSAQAADSSPELSS